MNIKSLVQTLKLRPGMYVGNTELESVYQFINGFLYNNIATNRVDKIDKEFKDQFHEWVKFRIEKKNNMEFDMESNYVYYISQAFVDTDDQLKLFFELTDDFFQEIEKRE